MPAILFGIWRFLWGSLLLAVRGMECYLLWVNDFTNADSAAALTHPHRHARESRVGNITLNFPLNITLWEVKCHVECYVLNYLVNPGFA